MPWILSRDFVQVAQLGYNEYRAPAFLYEDKNRNSAISRLSDRCAEILGRENRQNVNHEDATEDDEQYYCKQGAEYFSHVV